jgi:hypothetical protein
MKFQTSFYNFAKTPRKDMEALLAGLAKEG